MKRVELGGFRLAHAAWLLGIFAFFLPAATWNPVSRFNLTRALVEHHSLQVDPFVKETGDRALVGGRWYSDKPPLLAVVAVPAYALVHLVQRARGLTPDCEVFGTELHPAIRVTPNKAFRQALYVCSLATSGVAGVSVGLLLFELLRRRTTSPVAFMTSTLVLLGTPLFAYSTSFYSHVPAAALLLGAVACLDRRGARPPGVPPDPARLRGAGALLALVPSCEFLAVLPAALVLFWFVIVTEPRKRWRALANLALGAVLPALFFGAYQTAVFGAPWRTGYSFQTNPEFIAGHAAGFLGLHLPTVAGAFGISVGLRRGLLYLSPVAVFGVLFGYAYARRRRDWVFSAGLSSLALLFFVNAGYYMWWGGAAAGPRHLVPALPFLAAGVMLGLRAPQRWVRRLTLLSGCVSILNFTLLTAVGIEAPERGDLLYAYAWPRLLQGRLASYGGGTNLGLLLGLHGALSLAPLVLWGVAGWLYLWRAVNAGRPRASLEPS